jgi:hypothetical protein
VKGNVRRALEKHYDKDLEDFTSKDWKDAVEFSGGPEFNLEVDGNNLDLSYEEITKTILSEAVHDYNKALGVPGLSVTTKEDWGSIWKNKDSSIGDKLRKTFSNVDIGPVEQYA